MFDLIIVGSGLYGAVTAFLAKATDQRGRFLYVL